MSVIFAVSKATKDVLTATSPNDFIMHSDYNTFKIVASGTLLSQSVTGNPTTFTVAHGLSGVPGVYAFIKFPDGYITVPQGKERADTTPIDRYFTVEVDSTNIYFNVYKGSSANYSVSIQYFVFETPLSGSAPVANNSNTILAVTKPGYEITTDTNLDHYSFHSNYDTLKYHVSGSINVSTSGSNAESSITHGLGYVPFFTVYVNRLSPTNTWSEVPQVFQDFGAHLYLNAYADSSKIYFRAETATAVNTYNFYYKVFRNRINI